MATVRVEVRRPEIVQTSERLRMPRDAGRRPMVDQTCAMDMGRGISASGWGESGGGETSPAYLDVAIA